MIIDFYPVQQRWRKVGPIYRSRMAAALWHPDMEAFEQGRAEERGYPYRPTPWRQDLTPSHYDSCDWRWSSGRRGPQPAFWAYTCHSACHWLASLNLWVAMRAEPDRPWRILSSDAHSTVWDGAEMLWDLNFLALGVSASDAWDLAADEPDSQELPIGQPLHLFGEPLAA